MLAKRKGNVMLRKKIFFQRFGKFLRHPTLLPEGREGGRARRKKEFSWHHHGPLSGVGKRRLENFFPHSPSLAHAPDLSSQDGDGGDTRLKKEWGNGTIREEKREG